MESNLRSIATLLTFDSTPEEGESCAPVAAELVPEVPSVLWPAGTFGGLGSIGMTRRYWRRRRTRKMASGRQQN